MHSSQTKVLQVTTYPRELVLKLSNMCLTSVETDQQWSDQRCRFNKAVADWMKTTSLTMEVSDPNPDGGGIHSNLAK